SQTPPGYWLSPGSSLHLTFKQDLVPSGGQELSPSDATSQPKLHLPGNFCVLDVYMVFMIDIQSVRSGVARSMLHWFQPDLRVVSTSGGWSQLSSATTSNISAAYVGPQPLPGPLHQYAVLIFRQPPDFEFPECFESMLPATIDARAGFDLEQFMNVTRLSPPVAANYFS
ncbi:hypothetical protein CERZMDRAFT_15437, partial [Cercospora zeae-maydis SCOH1-5]